MGGPDPLITMAIWALGVFAVLATTWIQDRRERRHIEQIRDRLEVRIAEAVVDIKGRDEFIVTLSDRIDELETQMKKEGSDGTDDHSED